MAIDSHPAAQGCPRLACVTCTPIDRLTFFAQKTRPTADWPLAVSMRLDDVVCGTAYVTAWESRQESVGAGRRVLGRDEWA